MYSHVCQLIYCTLELRYGCITVCEDGHGVVSRLVVFFVVAVGLLLKFCRVVCGDCGAVAEVLLCCLW